MFLKIGVIFILVLILLVPTYMVKELIHEREVIQQSAIDEVSSKWGNGQTITGPYVLSSPEMTYQKKGVENPTPYKFTIK